jgi:ribosomal protein S18 acetylase RimI-like enzyme
MSLLSDDAKKEEIHLKIRSLRESDLPAVMRLKELARWNQTEKDWRRLLRLEPQGCFVACRQARVVATITTTTYGHVLAWIGMVIVDPEFRRRGIASVLMRTALDYLQQVGIATVKLDATPDGRFVYEELGFGRESLIERWEGIARPVEKRRCASLDEEMWSEMLDLDGRAFGADRSRLLDSLVKDSCARPLVLSAPDGRLQGYALARAGSRASYLGPLVAIDEQAFEALLDGMLGQLLGQKVYMDFNTGSVADTEALIKRGFTKQRDLLRMRYGQENPVGTSRFVFAIAGPEVG